MPLNPAITATVNITVADINGNSVAKQFNDVGQLHFDYDKGMVNIVDVTGSFYFTLLTITTLTYTVVAGAGAPVTTVIMS
jgi:hypothetical protein